MKQRYKIAKTPWYYKLSFSTTFNYKIDTKGFLRKKITALNMILLV